MMEACTYCGQYVLFDILIDEGAGPMHPGCAETFGEEYDEFLSTTSDEENEDEQAH
jgi:hypothetical protein